jgi:hypothetical protein
MLKSHLTVAAIHEWRRSSEGLSGEACLKSLPHNRILREKPVLRQGFVQSAIITKSPLFLNDQLKIKPGRKP